MMLKVLLISSFVGWVKCQESQTMTLEEKSVIRCKPITIVLMSPRTTVWDVIFFLIIVFFLFAQGADT